MFSQVDFPRMREARLTGAIWVITTNPLRPSRDRARVFTKNLDRLQSILRSCQDDIAIVRNAAEYRAAKQAGKHGAWIGVQGGNALDANTDVLDVIPDGLVVRVTVVHLTSSRLGKTSAPGLPRDSDGLSRKGLDYVKRLNEKKIFVDLAHISHKGFFDAVEVHDKSQPLIVTHTGIAGVHDHWRNLDNAQLRCIAQTGGTIGVMFHKPFLGPNGDRASSIVDHLEHVIKVIGEDFASLGSDWDGAIITPRDMPTCLELPRLVQIMLDRGWKEERVRKVLGGNWLRALEHLRG
jgi:membrane dipeptidase